MTRIPTHSYTPEKLAALDHRKLETLRDNARRLNAIDLLAMCESELASRAPPRQRKSLTSPQRSHNDVVTGYHFVCSKERGVTEAAPGQFWSGSWVVAEHNVRESLKFGAYLALHETKADRSYRQGQILDYRKSARDMVDKDNEGIEFLVQETSKSYDWVGGGAGEKGYSWSKRSSDGSQFREDSE